MACNYARCCQRYEGRIESRPFAPLYKGDCCFKANLPRRKVRPFAASRELPMPLPDGDLGLPIVGETLHLIFSGDIFGSSRRHRYGDVYKTNILGAPTIMVYGEEAVRAVLSAEDRLVASDWPQVTCRLVGPQSLNLLSGSRHSTAKRVLSDAFSERQMRRHVPRIAQVVQDGIAGWVSQPQPLSGFMACQELSQAVFDVVVLGGAGGPQRASILQQLMTRLQAGFQTPPLELPFTDYGKAVQARRDFGALVKEALEGCRRRRLAASASTVSADSILADLVALASVALTSTDTASGCPLPEQQQQTTAAESLLTESFLSDNLAAAFFGNASTGPSLSKALQYLAAHPAVMQALRKEQQAIVASQGVGITAEVLDEMSYGSAVAKELLRITPTVPAVFRYALTDFELQGRRIPKGWRVWCHLGDAVLKYNMDSFQPERWMPSLGTTWQQPSAATGAASPTPSQPAVAEGAVGSVVQGLPTEELVTVSEPTGGGCPVHSPGPLTQGSPGYTTTAEASRTATEYSLPFGTGVRACLGRQLVFSELLVVLAVLAREYEWQAENVREEWRLVPAPAPKAGLRVTMWRR